jgi:hypothetical protein
MNIRLLTQPTPTLPEHIVGRLDDMNPRTFMKWNKRHRRVALHSPCWEGRWEIWCELIETTHEDAASDRALSDEWNQEAGCWMRKLQTYSNEDGSFAPVDERLLVGLDLADTWANKNFYQDHVSDPYTAQDDALTKDREEIYADGARYFKDHDRTLVGANRGSHRGGADWRWRIR